MIINLVRVMPPGLSRAPLALQKIEKACAKANETQFCNPRHQPRLLMADTTAAAHATTPREYNTALLSPLANFIYIWCWGTPAITPRPVFA